MGKSYFFEEELRFFETKIELFKNKKIRIEDLFYSLNVELPVFNYFDLFYTISLNCKDIKEKKIFISEILDRRSLENKELKIETVEKILDSLLEKNSETGEFTYQLNDIISDYKSSLNIAVFLLDIINDDFYNKHKFFILNNHINHLDVKNDKIRNDMMKNYKTEDVYPLNLYSTFNNLFEVSAVNLKNIRKSIDYLNENKENLLTDSFEFYEEEHFLHNFIFFKTEQEVGFEEKNEYMYYITNEFKKNKIKLKDVLEDDYLLYKINKMDNELFECFIDCIFKDKDIDLLNYLFEHFNDSNFAGKNENIYLNKESFFKRKSEEEKIRINQYIKDKNENVLMNKKRI